MYPAFPTKQPDNIVSETPKIPLIDAMDFYDKLVSLGLHPIPKQRYGKAPHYEVWKTTRRLPVDRDEAMSMQAKDIVSGWMIAPFMETTRILVVDMDVAAMQVDPEYTYHEFQQMCPTQFVVYTPSNGVHLYYRLRDDQIAPNRVKVMDGVELRSPDISMAIAVQGGILYTGDKARNKGVADGHLGWYTLAGELELPEISDELLDRLKPALSMHAENTFVATDTGSRVVHQHYTLDLEEREKVVAEALDWAFKELDGDYQVWTLLWMSAFHASDGSQRIAQYIVDHPQVVWSDGDEGKQTFLRNWTRHIPREGGVTVSTLFHYAYAAGWMSQSPVDIIQTDEPEEGTIEINTQRMSEWVESVEELPVHALVHSQTGSGKTWAFRSLWHRLGKPKSIVFVPSIRLALDMAKKLRDEFDIPAEAYRDEESMEILPSNVMLSVPVLVTTLQTFIQRLYVPDVGYMNNYGLVYIEECDQLLSSFSRALGENASHVTQKQSVLGFDALREAFASMIPVWGVDATATRVSWHTFKRLSPTFTFVRNTYVSPKPEVRIIPDKLGAYTRVATTLSEGGTVVAPCDTKAEAETLVQTMQALGLVTDKDSLAITADTGMYDERVVMFAANANREAPSYKLVAYNTTMASGVSVTDVVPDVVVQFSSGYLTPRVNLQLLNRYRRQEKVYCYYSNARGADLVVKAPKLIMDAKEWVEEEAQYMNLPEATRSDMSKLRDEVRALAEMDEVHQRRSPLSFYRRLLANDGRNTVDVAEIVVQRVVDGHQRTVEGRKEARELLASSWRDVPPAADRHQMGDGYDELDIRRAMLHAWIISVLGDSAPADEDQTYIYDVVRRLHKKVGALTAFVRQSEAVRSAEKALANRDRAYLSMSPTISRVILAGMLRYLFNEPAEVLTNEQLEHRALPFVRMIEDREAMYKAVVRQADRQLPTLRVRYEGDVQGYALSIAKHICTSIGLKLRRSAREGWHITNLVEVEDFLRWYYGEAIPVEFDTSELESIRQERKEQAKRIARMSDKERESLMRSLTTLPMNVALEMRRL